MTHHIQQCKSCDTEVQGELYHLGFSDMEALYCERCPNVLLIKDPDFYRRIGVSPPNLSAGDEGWLEYNRHLLPFFGQVESHLPTCSCGGCFRYMAAPRCAACNDYIFAQPYSEPIDRSVRHVFVSKDSVRI